MSNQYVLLTGSKNNAGDFLIKYRAKQLFADLRPDRTIVDLDAWKTFSESDLETVNASKALVLMGGPALQAGMRSKIYPMVPDLGNVKVPILTMGIGWKSAEGSWDSSNYYPLDKETITLLARINESGYASSVRDYHTLNVLLKNGLNNFLMTGCPALYSLPHIGMPFLPRQVKNVSYSLGVSFVESPEMEKSMKSNILGLARFFEGKNFVVTFHHALAGEFYKTSPELANFQKKHESFAKWLDSEGICYKDVSGSAESLIEHYRNCDLHIGYRVHAHIFMSSESRLSVLLNEDGRGKALKDVISGLVLDGYRIVERDLRLHAPKASEWGARVLNKVYRQVVQYQPTSEMHSFEHLTQNLLSNLAYEMSCAYPRLSLSRPNIDAHFVQMKRYLEQLP